MGNALDDGFLSRLPQTDDRIEAALRRSLVSIDANVLLSFYRYSPKARDALAEVLTALGDRLFVSHQAAREFWRNRIYAIDDRTAATEQFVDAIDKQQRAMESSLASWAKQTALPDKSKREIQSRLGENLGVVRQMVTGEASDDGTVAYEAAKDSIVQLLREIVANRVGSPMSDSDHAEAVKEAAHRVAEGTPPGFADADKAQEGGADGAAGDFLVWRQSLDEAKSRGMSLVLITGDEKEDWWWRHKSQFLGPRSELVDECTQEVGAPLVMLRPVDLIKKASVLDVIVSQEVIEDVATKSSPAETPWTRWALGELLQRLDAEGSVQAEVIREAARRGGVITRDQIYELAGYDSSRQLKGFTRPVARITQDLQSEDLLEGGVRAALRPRYHGGVYALDFVIPEEMTTMLSDGRPLRGQARLVEERPAGD